jgi:hypothetical protein
VIWINLVAVSALGVGFTRAWNLIRERRKPLYPDNAVLSWRENPASVFRYDAFQGLTIILHGLAIAVVAVLLLGSVNRAAGSPLSLSFTSPAEEWLKSVVGVIDRQIGHLSFVSAALASGVAGFTLGGLLAFPIVRWRVRPILVHVVPDGVVYGNTFCPWSGVGPWQADDRRRIIRLHSRSGASAPMLVLQPPYEQAYRAALEGIRAKVPQVEGDRIAQLLRRRRLLGPILLVSVFIALLVAVLAHRYLAEWVWLLLVAELVALELGGQLLPAL